MKLSLQYFLRSNLPLALLKTNSRNNNNDDDGDDDDDDDDDDQNAFAPTL